ncbi:YlmC/YmxH family sporulation protein [Desulfitispora alkaliphila]|uniref:YlmC/YmxH family sporulation protein n=1 Tax=Desulfitispora alkaliphila TaxID=622674 RepID=UPI003D1F5571
MVKISDLRQRDVINIIDGRRLGVIKDIELDVEVGKVTSIIMPGQSNFLGFFSKNEDLVIKWEQIKKIGIDVILVEVANSTDINR